MFLSAKVSVHPNPKKFENEIEELPRVPVLTASSEESYVVKLVVEPQFRGWRLDHYICTKIPRLSRSKVQAIIRTGKLSERLLKPSTLVQPGMVLNLTRPKLVEPETPQELPIIYRDEAVLVVDKPAGLPMHPSARYLRGTLVALARNLAMPGEKPDPAHRLDRETSGLVLCGVRPEQTRFLKLAFAQGLVKKAYLAITEGVPSEKEFEVDLPLAVGGQEVRIRVRVDNKEGKSAKTRFRVLQEWETKGEFFALLRCEPITGRQHQIRAHLAAKGFPLVGDKIYGRDERIFIRFTQNQVTTEDWAKLRLTRHALHASEMEFPHPLKKKNMKLFSPIPVDMRNFVTLNKT